MAEYGDATIELVESVIGRGVQRGVLLMRHSAREYEPGRHDLENPLTESGRSLAHRLGERLPKSLLLRGYASPPQRCMETAELVLAGHATGGGGITRHRPLEALGVFYALDQMRMWKGMNVAGGLLPYMQQWFDGQVPADAMMAPELAVRLVLRVLAEKLRAPGADSQLDVCVSHDMTLYLLRDRLLGERLQLAPVEYLDGLLLFEAEGALRLAGHRGLEVTFAADIFEP